MLTASLALGIYTEVRAAGARHQIAAVARAEPVVATSKQSSAKTRESVPRRSTQRVPMTKGNSERANESGSPHQVRILAAAHPANLATAGNSVIAPANHTFPSSSERRSPSTGFRSLGSPSQLAVQDKPATTAAVLQSPAPLTPAPVPVTPAAVPFAMLHATGRVLLSGNSSADSAIFPGETIETPADTYATILRDQSQVLVRPGSRLKMGETCLELERGDVLMTTATDMSVQADSLKITPMTHIPTEFEVVDNAEAVRVAAYQGAVLVNDGSTTAQLNEGQSTTREKGTHKQSEAQPAAKGGLHHKKAALILLGASGATAATIAILKSGGNGPLSPSRP